MRILVYVAAVAAVLAALTYAAAQERRPLQGLQPLCRTEQELKQLLELRKQDMSWNVALNHYNGRNPGQQCQIKMVRLVPDLKLGSVLIGTYVFEVWQVTVLAEYTAWGWKNITSFTAFTVNLALLQEV